MPEGTVELDRFFGALDERREAFIDILKSQNERRHRLTRAILDEAENGQADVLEQWRRWAEQPMDFISATARAIESSGRAQARAFELTRIWLEAAAETQRELGEVFGRIVQVDRTVGEAVVAAGRETVASAARRVQAAVLPTTDGAVEQPPVEAVAS